MSEKFLCLISIAFVLALAGGASAEMVAHWSFDDALTDSVGSLNWTSNGGATFSTDAQEGSHSLSLDGTGAYLSQTAVGPLLVEFSTKTVTLWFKADSAGGTKDQESPCFSVELHRRAVSFADRPRRRLPVCSLAPCGSFSEASLTVHLNGTML